MATDDGKNQGKKEEVVYDTLGELIENVWLPQCLTIGITYELFPRLNPRTIEPFRKAFQQKKDEEIATIEYTAWRNGLYVASAIGACFSKNGRYLDRPIEVRADKLQKNGAELFGAWAQAYNKAHPELT